MSELVKRGHDQVAELKSSCGAVDVRDVAQLISDLATQLDVQLARSNALAAENACLKQSIEEVSEEFETGTDGALATAVDESLNLLTPETDAVLKRIQAQGVAMFASKCKEESKCAHSSDARDFWWVSGENADDFAAQLRQEAAQ
ncbi:hypothetical protein [Escherichia coli]|uniref:hypothetical protein n=1 Tax=Escherichia coli TaxID=562 RepID=UPI001AECBCA5|nr:hypothetical protein [Escherichia coli]MBP2745296.1 hypothetical protein [Escherichia coli]